MLRPGDGLGRDALFDDVGNEKGRLFDGFDETNKQTPERSYKILRKDRSILRPQKGRFSGFYL